MLTAYFDDSGTDASGPFCVVAGYISDAERWEAFAGEWDRELRGAPAITHLKMSQAQSMRGPFAGWDSAARDKKVLRLAKTVNRHALGGFASIVSHSIYAKEAKSFLPDTINNPYWLCFHRLVLEVLWHYRHSEVGKINFVFDTQGEGYERRAGLMHRQWPNVIPAHFASMIGSLTFASDRDVLPLQAADLLAWHIRRRGDRAVQKSPPENRQVDSVLGEIPVAVYGWTADEISAFVEDYQRGHPLSPVNRPDLHSR